MKVTLKGKHRGILPWKTLSVEIIVEAETLEEMKALLKDVQFNFTI